MAYGRSTLSSVGLQWMVPAPPRRCRDSLFVNYRTCQVR
jgi:hypothetical protein